MAIFRLFGIVLLSISSILLMYHIKVDREKKMPNLGVPELLIILFVVLLFFGAKKLPELSRTIGSSVKELRGSLSDDEKKDDNKPTQG